MSEFELKAKISYNDLVKFIMAFGKEEVVAVTVADYLTSCIDYEMDLSFYIWNTLLFNVMIFDSAEEVDEYINNMLSCTKEDCIIYKAGNGKYYLQW